MKKIFPIVLCLFIVLTVFTIPTISKKNTLRTNFELEQVEIEPTNTIYLLNQNGYFTEVGVILPNQDLINEIIDMLKENQSHNKWKGYLPKDLEVIDFEIKEKKLSLNLSKKIKEEYIPGLVHSLLSPSIQEINLLVCGEEKETYNKKIPLNKEFRISDRNNLEKVTVYYMDDIEKNYLVPVTKYLNQKDEKIEIILEELKNNIPKDLISYVDKQLELLDYEIGVDYISLNFNDEFSKNPSTKEKIIQEISNSIFDNYDTSSIFFKVNNRLDRIVTRNG